MREWQLWLGVSVAFAAWFLMLLFRPWDFGRTVQIWTFAGWLGAMPLMHLATHRWPAWQGMLVGGFLWLGVDAIVGVFVIGVAGALQIGLGVGQWSRATAVEDGAVHAR